MSSITIQKLLNGSASSAPASSAGWPWRPRPRGSRSNSRPSRSPSSRSSIRAFASATSRAGRRASCSRPTPSWSARSRASGGSTCTRWSTPTAATASASCTSPSNRRRRWPCCTTRFCCSTATWICRCGRCSPTTAASSAAPSATLTKLYLALNEIEHRTTRVGSPKTNGFVERFNGTVLQEFFRPAMHRKLYGKRRGPAGRPRRLAAPLQPRPAPPRLPQPGPPAVGHDRAIRQTRRLRGHLSSGLTRNHRLEEKKEGAGAARSYGGAGTQ